MPSEETRVAIERLRWGCRRGLLELDLIFQRFNSNNLERLDATQRDAFGRLLRMSDNDIWDLLTGKQSTNDVQIGYLLDLLDIDGEPNG